MSIPTPRDRTCIFVSALFLLILPFYLGRSGDVRYLIGGKPICGHINQRHAWEGALNNRELQSTMREGAEKAAGAGRKRNQQDTRDSHPVRAAINTTTVGGDCHLDERYQPQHQIMEPENARQSRSAISRDFTVALTVRASKPTSAAATRTSRIELEMPLCAPKEYQ